MDSHEDEEFLISLELVMMLCVGLASPVGGIPGGCGRLRESGEAPNTC